MVDNHTDDSPSRIEMHKQAAPLVINMHTSALVRCQGQGIASQDLMLHAQDHEVVCETANETFADRDKRLVSLCTNAGAPAMQPGQEAVTSEDARDILSLWVSRF